VETSAKTRFNVEETFYQVVREYWKSKIPIEAPPTVEENNVNSSKCCIIM